MRIVKSKFFEPFFGADFTFPDSKMERLPRNPEEADKLLLLADLLRDAALTVKEEWAQEDFSRPADKDTARILPSVRLWEATKTIETISGAVVELVCEPNQRVLQILTQYFESRALFIAAERRIPALLAEAGAQGLDIDVLAVKTGIEASKLCTASLLLLHCQKTSANRFRTQHALSVPSVRSMFSRR